MTKVIKEQQLNRVVVAAVTPITHEVVFADPDRLRVEQVPLRDGQYPQPGLGPLEGAREGHGS